MPHSYFFSGVKIKLFVRHQLAHLAHREEWVSKISYNPPRAIKSWDLTWRVDRQFMTFGPSLARTTE